MYLGSRLIGISTYLAVFIFFILWIKNHKVSRAPRSMLVWLVLLCTMGYFYEPAPEADLYRVRVYAMDFAHYSWREFFRMLKNRNAGAYGTPAGTIFYRLIGLTGNVRMLPMVSCLICVGCIFLVVRKTAKWEKTGSIAVSLTLLWLLSADFFMPIIATIRSYVAAIIVFFCIYREARDEKSMVFHLPLYVIAGLFHTVGFVFVLTRFLSLFLQPKEIQKHKMRYLVLLLMIFVIFRGQIMQVVGARLTSAQSYMSDATSAGAYSYIWERLILMILTTTHIWILRRANEQMQNQRYSRYIHTFLAAGKVGFIVELIAFFQFTFYMRTSFFTSILLAPVYMRILKNEKSIVGSFPLFYMTACSMVMLMLTLTRGYLCSLKFF